MKSSTLIPIAALTLALSVSPAVQAQGRYDDRYDRNDRRSDSRYDNRFDARRVAVVAHEIEEAAYSIRREAERNNRRPDRWEERMLLSLRELNQEADQFHAQVESGRYGSNRSERDFAELVRAYRETWSVLERVDRRSYVDRGMDRIGMLLSDLSGYYGRRADYRYNRGGRWDRDDRYGHDRDGRWDGDRRH
jgi:hypothetical protein